MSPGAQDPFPFDAVIFDLDGTLVATERFWVAAADAGASRAFAELGISRALPSAGQWMSMVGLDITQAFEQVFADLDPAQRARVMACCEEEESRALRAGGAALLPGALETLRELKARGVRLGIASNCNAQYLKHMLSALPLREFIDEPRCLDSPRVQCKADMVGDLLAAFGTRSAVMVGDRYTDAEAAHAHGIPHVHLAHGFAPPGEEVEAEARLSSLIELVPRLCARTRWIESVLTSLSILRGGRSARGGPTSLGITGASAGGKTLFARDAARLIEARGRACTLVPLDDYRRVVEQPLPAGANALDRVAAHYDFERMIEELLVPHRAGLPARRAGGEPVAPDSLVIVEGPFLLHPRIRLALDRALFLGVDEKLALTRIASRDGLEVLAEARRHLHPIEREFHRCFPPSARADLCVEASNPVSDTAAADL